MKINNWFGAIAITMTFSSAVLAAEITDEPRQAKTLFEQMVEEGGKGIYEEKVPEKNWDDLAQSMMKRDYTVTKVYQEVLVETRHAKGSLTCKYQTVLITGANKDIGEYAKKKSFKKRKQIRYGFLGTLLSMGASVYTRYVCETDSES